MRSLLEYHSSQSQWLLCLATLLLKSSSSKERIFVSLASLFSEVIFHFISSLLKMKLSAPTPQIQWYKDGKQIVTGESVIVSFILVKKASWRISESYKNRFYGVLFSVSLKVNFAFLLQIEGGGSSLLLRNGNPKDEGRYTCAAISPAGNATIHINVQLISKSVCFFAVGVSIPLPSMSHRLEVSCAWPNLSLQKDPNSTCGSTRPLGSRVTHSRRLSSGKKDRAWSFLAKYSDYSFIHSSFLRNLQFIQVKAIPPPAVTWSLNGRPLSREDNRFTIKVSH